MLAVFLRAAQYVFPCHTSSVSCVWFSCLFCVKHSCCCCCRERQKETISSLEAEVTEKLAQLQALSAENEMLKLRSAVLEATVKGREYHVSAAVATCAGVAMWVLCL
jgi:NADH:ubiquinone oxidoreductase subunit F (NADH-binding)